MKDIITTLKPYWFDITDPEQNQKCLTLYLKLKKQGLQCFRVSYAGPTGYQVVHYGNYKEGEVTLDTNSLFSDQWNSVEGERLFDWAEDYSGKNFIPNIRCGYYLEQTSEMKEVRSNTYECGYCGATTTSDDPTDYHHDCAGNQHLGSNILSLIQWKNLYEEPLHGTEWSEIAEEVRKHHEGELRKRLRNKANDMLIKNCKTAKSKFDNTIRKEHELVDIRLWLADNLLDLDNIIHYGDCVCYGWRERATEREREILQKCPFEIVIK